MKRFFLAAVLAVSAVFGMQAEDIAFSVKAGVGTSSWVGKDSPSNSARFAYRVGFGVDVPITGKFGFQTGINFEGLGVSTPLVKTEEMGMKIDSKFKATQLYLELPLMATLRYGVGSGNLVFNAGPYLGVGVGGNTKIEVNEGETSSKTFGDNGLKRFDMGVGLGVGYEFSKFLVGIDTRYGFLHLSKGAQDYNIAMFVNFGYRF